MINRKGAKGTGARPGKQHPLCAPLRYGYKTRCESSHDDVVNDDGADSRAGR